MEILLGVMIGLSFCIFVATEGRTRLWSIVTACISVSITIYIIWIPLNIVSKTVTSDNFDNIQLNCPAKITKTTKWYPGLLVNPTVNYQIGIQCPKEKEN
jgi:hypothetical protein